MLITLVVVGWVSYNVSEKNQIKEEKQAEKLIIETIIKNNVASLNKEYMASNAWIDSLKDEKDYLFKPILTIELEKAWLSDKKILFHGSLLDIATLDEEHYTVTFESNLWADYYIFDTELRLSLKAKKKLIDKFMSEYPELLSNNGVAVVAHIKKISSSQIVGGENAVIDVKTGHGELLGVVYTDDVKLEKYN